MFMTKREEEDRLTVKLTLYKDNLQPKKRPKQAADEAEPEEPVRQSTISIVPVQYSSTVLPRPRLVNKESSVNSTKILLRRHAHVPKRNHNVHEFFKAIYQGRIRDILYFLRIVSIRSEDPQDGKTPLMAALHVASDAKRREVFDYLASHGATFAGVDATCGRDLVGWAALLGRSEQLQRILADTTEETDFQRLDAKGHSCLHLGVMSGSHGAVQLLVEAMLKLGVSVDLLDAEGITPYILARKLGFGRIAQLLQEKGKASSQLRDPVSFRSPREWSALGRRQRLMEKQRMLRTGNWGVLPLTEEELQQLQELQELQEIQELQELGGSPRPAERGETFAEIAMRSLAPKRTTKTSQELVHCAFDVWSQQHLPAYRRGVQSRPPGGIIDADAAGGAVAAKGKHSRHRAKHRAKAAR